MASLIYKLRAAAELAVELNQPVAAATHDEDGNIFFTEPDCVVDAALIDERAEQLEAQKLFEWEDLRAERDRLISKTDSWALSDRTMTAEQTAYRQALRDLPANTADPANPVWPTKPE